MIWLQSKLLHPIVQVLVTDVPAQRTVFWKSNHGNSNLQNDKSREYWMAMDAASGKTIVTEPVVIFNGEGVSKTAGPAAKRYERARTAAGANLLFNTLYILVDYFVLLLTKVYEGQSASGVHEYRKTQNNFGLILDGNRSIQVDYGIIIHVLTPE